MSLTVERIRELASTRVFLRATITQIADSFTVDLLAIAFSEGWLAGVDYTFSTLSRYEAGGACFFEAGGAVSLERSLKNFRGEYLSDKETYVEISFLHPFGNRVEGTLSDWRLLQAVCLASKRVQQIREYQEKKKNAEASVQALGTLYSRLGGFLIAQNKTHFKSLMALGRVG